MSPNYFFAQKYLLLLIILVVMYIFLVHCLIRSDCFSGRQSSLRWFLPAKMSKFRPSKSQDDFFAFYYGVVPFSEVLFVISIVTVHDFTLIQAFIYVRCMIKERCKMNLCGKTIYSKSGTRNYSNLYLLGN
jgi:hypothetical protein